MYDLQRNSVVLATAGLNTQHNTSTYADTETNQHTILAAYLKRVVIFKSVLLLNRQENPQPLYSVNESTFRAPFWRLQENPLRRSQQLTSLWLGTRLCHKPEKNLRRGLFYLTTEVCLPVYITNVTSEITCLSLQLVA